MRPSPESVLGCTLSRLPFSSSIRFGSASTESLDVVSEEDDMVSSSESSSEGWRCSQKVLEGARDGEHAKSKETNITHEEGCEMKAA